MPRAACALAAPSARTLRCQPEARQLAAVVVVAEAACDAAECVAGQHGAVPREIGAVRSCFHAARACTPARARAAAAHGPPRAERLDQGEETPRSSFRAHSEPPARKRRKAFLRSASLVAHAWSHPGFQLESRVMWRLAAGVGAVDVLEWLRPHLMIEMDASICAAAAGAGQLGALQWLRGQGCPWDSETCASAAKGGHLEVLRWLRGQDCPWNRDTCSDAAEGGHLEVLQWAREHGCAWEREKCLDDASLWGHHDAVAWIDAHEDSDFDDDQDQDSEDASDRRRTTS